MRCMDITAALALISYEQSQITQCIHPVYPTIEQRTIAVIDQNRLIMLNMKDSFTFKNKKINH